MKLSLIIPCFNEAGNVRPLFDKINEVFENKINDYEFVFVNDGSKDETFKNLKEICESSSRPVKVVNFSRNFGKEAAIFAGLKEASGDLISLIDADLQQNPEYVVKMVDYLDENPEYDCVTAFQEKRKEGAFLRFCKRRFYHLINKMSDTEFVDGASDFRTFRKAMKDAILEMSEYHRFSKGIFSWVGFNTYYMPYAVDERLSGTTKWSFWKLFKYAIEGIVAFTTVPLKISTYTGFFTSLASLIYIIVVIVEKLAFGIAVPGYATIVVLILFLGGLQLLALGINGEYLSKTYIQTKNRPIYIAREIITNDKK
ncbi:MAG: glycosyltransferase family 2 protein [Oscillospiraceae bacterium]|nr:glycosyltransferase family 2 protein [Candidatus Limimonas coprohippi]